MTTGGKALAGRINGEEAKCMKKKGVTPLDGAADNAHGNGRIDETRNFWVEEGSDWGDGRRVPR